MTKERALFILHQRCKNNTEAEEALEFLKKSVAQKSTGCGDAISREEYINCYKAFDYSENGRRTSDDALAIRVANSLPPVTPKQKSGKWLVDLQTATEDYYVCSECGRRIHLLYPDTIGNYPYCHCGAIMDKPPGK